MWWKIPLGLIALFAIAVAVLLSRVDITPGIIIHSLTGSVNETPAESSLQNQLKLPEGFSVGLYAENVINARFIEFTETGDLIVAQPRSSSLMLLARDANADGKSDNSRTLMSDLDRPHSVDFHNGYLYVAEATAVGRVRFNHEKGELDGEYERIITGLGAEGNHWTKTIRFGPDDLLYLSSGSTCNVCLEEDEQRATIYRYNPDGTDRERFATGLRNSVGFDWSPVDGHLYATDNGRDLLGNDYPPCELNRVEAGHFYGWPQINGFGDLDPDFGDEAKLAEATSPVHGFRAHNAPLGIRFITGKTFPAEYGNSALVALHGSWNRSTYDGYKVVSLHQNEDGSFDERDFLTGFELDGNIIGRPVDIAEGPDDCVYVSDDYANAIFRVCYGEAQAISNVTVSNLDEATGLEHLSASEIQGLETRGEQLYKTRGCVACHTTDSDSPGFGMKPLQNIASKYNTGSLESFFKTPTPPMPPVRLGSKEEELALSAYLLSL